MKLLQFLSLVYFIFIIVPLESQENIYKVFSKQIEIVNRNSDSILKIQNDSIRLGLSKDMELTLIEILKNPYSFSLTFDSLKKIGKTNSPDHELRIITWNIPLLDGTNKYFGIIQMNPKKDSLCKLFILKDISYKNSLSFSEVTLNHNEWFGALYYNIIPNKIDGQTTYTLLGMHFNDLFTNKKVIDILKIDNSGNIQFGMPIFLYNSKYVNRIVFEYSINVTMILKYDEKLKMLIFDHLAPPSPLYSGNFKFYGPDFSYDGLQFEKNKWLHISNVNYHK